MATRSEPTVGGILLAAGESTRYEAGNKLLAAIDGEPVVCRAARTLVASPVTAAVAIVGYQAEAVESALESVDIETRRNEAFPEGQSTSVQRGVTVARDRGWDAIVFALGDMPFVDLATFERLLDAYTAGEGTVIVPSYRGQRGNPALFDASHFDALAAVTGDRGGREIIEDAGTLVTVDDPGIHRDIDRENDLQ